MRLFDHRQKQPLEHFRFTRCHLEIVQGGFYFYPSDEGLSLGTPLRKKPLGLQLSVKIRIENAVAGDRTFGVRAEYRLLPDRIAHLQARESAVQQVVIQLLHPLTFRADRGHRLRPARSQW